MANSISIIPASPVASAFDMADRYQITTTDNTPTTIATIPTVTNVTYTIQARAVADAGVGEAASLNVAALIINDGGNLTLVGIAPLFSPITTPSLPNVDVTYSLSGTNILVWVTGEPSVTIRWKVGLTIVTV